MYNQSISFVVPAYNEKDNIEKAVDNAYIFLRNNFHNFEIIIVDDGSIDETQLICQNLLSLYRDKLVVLRHLNNRGYGAALRTGLFSAKNDLVFYTDSDNQFDINEISNFMEYIDDYDLVIGYRENRKDVLIRKFSSFVFNRIIFLLFGLDVKDIDCSFKLFKKDSLKKISIDTDEFLVDAELLIKARLKNLKIKQLAVTHLPRMAGKSTVRIRHVFSSIRDIYFLRNNLELADKS